MCGGAWVLVLLWACLAECLCGAVEDSSGETPDHLDYKYDTNYIAMKKAASGVNIPNPDVMVLYGIEAASLHYALTHKLSHLFHRHFTMNNSKNYVAVLYGECVPPQPPGHGRCLTERDARMLMLKEARLALHSAAAMITEAGVRTRLQWFKENGVDDIVLSVSASVQKFIHDMIETFHAPVTNFWKQIVKFRSILVDRYLFGGNADKLLSTADAVSSEVHGILGAMLGKQYPLDKFYYSTLKRVQQYCVMFQDHFESVLSMPPQELYKDSPYPFSNRYWDARALEYAVTLLFLLRKEANVRDKKEFDMVLEDLYTKLDEGQTKAALEFAGHLLSKAMDRLGHRIFSKYMEQPMQELIARLPIPLPTNLEDLNPLCVPRSLSEAEISPTQNLIQHYLDQMEEDGMSNFLSERIVPYM